MPLHALAHIINHNVDSVEATIAFTVTDTVVPALRILIKKAADEVMELMDNDLPIAQDIAQEMILNELANLLTMTEVWNDELIRPHQLTQENARRWLISPAKLKALAPKSGETPAADTSESLVDDLS